MIDDYLWLTIPDIEHGSQLPGHAEPGNACLRIYNAGSRPKMVELPLIEPNGLGERFARLSGIDTAVGENIEIMTGILPAMAEEQVYLPETGLHIGTAAGWQSIQVSQHQFFIVREAGDQAGYPLQKRYDGELYLPVFCLPEGGGEQPFNAADLLGCGHRGATVHQQG
jgi:hypothetical protein